MIKNIYEILDEFELAPTKQEKKQILQQNDLYHLKELLKYTFDKKYQFYVEDKFPTDYIEPDTAPGRNSSRLLHYSITLPLPCQQ